MWPKYDKPFFFYIRKEQPSANGITVCLIPTDGGFAPGVAICSESDNFCKKTGRSIAFGRAEIASATNQFVKASNFDELSQQAVVLAKKAMDAKVANFKSDRKQSLANVCSL